MKASLFPIIMWLCLLTSCSSTHKVTSTHTFATDSAVQVQRHQWQTSRIDSVWRHTELLFDSCIVSFGVGAETPTIEVPMRCKVLLTPRRKRFPGKSRNPFVSMAHTFRQAERRAPRQRQGRKTASLRLGNLPYNKFSRGSPWRDHGLLLSS